MGNGAGAFGHLASISSSGTVTIDGIVVPLPVGKSLPLPSSKEPAPSGGGWSLIAGDFNADGRADLALTSATGIELLPSPPSTSRTSDTARSRRRRTLRPA
jgi:hypothetical protein